MADHRRENQQLWNEWSDDFQAIWNSEIDEGELPPAPSPFGPDAPGGRQPQILDTVEGREYVELGCGGGQGTVGTAQLGPETAVGIDFSAEQLAHARELRDRYDVDAQFVEGDVTALPFADDSFDVASSEAVFQMVEQLDEAFGEAHRVLREDGVLVVSFPHPFFEMLDIEEEAFEYSYFDTGRREITIDEEFESVMVAFDRMVSDIHNALVDAGFEVRRLLETEHHSIETEDREESDLPDLLWKVPGSVRFWAVAR